MIPRRLSLTGILLLAGCCTGCCSAGPGRLEPRSAAELAARADEVRAEAPLGFTVVTAAPFVVAGDGTPEAVRADAREVVEAAAAWLKQNLFPREPEEILVIWMFEGEESYRRHVSILFGGTPPSPYGYYDPCEGALVADVTLGTGTLIHEMVHAFVDANLPGAPPWFNEGLASLYEHTERRDGELRGRINWRLPALQDAIQEGPGPRFQALVAMSRGDFYDEAARGLNYAAARYLLYWLQERGLLIRYVRRFAARREADPSGLAALQEVLGERDMGFLQARWEAFVARLPPP